MGTGASTTKTCTALVVAPTVRLAAAGAARCTVVAGSRLIDAPNAVSNALRRSVGFTVVGERDVTFAGRLLRTSRWRIDPSADLG